MAHIQIGRTDALRLYQYCVTYNVEWYVAKDKHGAYVTAVYATDYAPVMRFFNGCNPYVNSDAHAAATRLFGEGDYREVLPRDWLRMVAADDTISRLQVNVDNERLTCEFLRSPL